MSERFWSVVGYDNDSIVFERRISVDDIAESDVKALLQRLAARELSEDEVVAASMDSSAAGGLSISRLPGDSFGFTTPAAAGRRYVATLTDTVDDEDDEEDETVEAKDTVEVENPVEATQPPAQTE